MRPHEPALLIEDHAVIGDTYTMALVGKDGSIDWLCLPRFDSAACFAALLGDEGHGRYQICPRGYADGVVTRTSRRYREGTLVLETEWETATGVVRLVDAMPPRDSKVDVVRRVEGVSGEVEMALRFTVRFGYGRDVPWVRRHTDHEGRECLTAIAGPDAVVLRGDLLPEPDDGAAAHHTTFSVKAGEHVDFSLMWFPSNEPTPAHVSVGEGLAQAESYWREWSATSTYDGLYPEAVGRSLLTLKAMTYSPTGGLVAAPTTSLPEQLGGPRNWDYRYCWIRDATLALLALLSAGYTAEASDWVHWLVRAVAGSPEQLQIMYGLSGERQLPEQELGWLPGYEASAPVRIGNAAAEQTQLDVYGEIISALYQARKAGIELHPVSWSLEKAIMRRLVEVKDDKDLGLWEMRSDKQWFTHSRVMVWVAFDRAVRSVEEHGLDGEVELWRTARDEIHAEICEKGWNEQLQSFTQAYGSTQLDAAVLVMASVGFLEGTDERFVKTVDAVGTALRRGPLVDRYTQGSDGLPGGEGSFLACSFWLVTALAQSGRLDEARDMFEELLTLRNDVGLLAEEYDGTAQRMVGNFPQAFSHLALVDAAMALAGDGGLGW